MSNLGREELDDYKFLRIADAMTCINQKVNLIGVVTEFGIAKKSKGTDYYCTLRIADESHPSSGFSVNFFTETYEGLPQVESSGDVIQLLHVVIKSHESVINAVFNKKFSSFALYDGRERSTYVPYQSSSRIRAGEQDKKFIASLRKWRISLQPETASSGSLSLKDIKQGCQVNLICKVLHICQVAGKWMLFIWDGTDAPPANVHTKLEEEFENPLPLQLEESTLPRNILYKFPTVGTVLRMTTDKCNGNLGLHLLKAGKWYQFKTIEFEVRYGLWCAILLPNTKLSYLLREDDYVLQSQRTHNERVEGKWCRIPLSLFTWPSQVTETDYQNVCFSTLMDIFSYPEVTAKFRCVVRVMATLPCHPSNFRASCGTYNLRLTLEDPTARIHAFLQAEDAVKFFGGYPSIDTMIKMHKVLLGVEDNERPRNPPWVECCIKSFSDDENDKWGSRRYRIFGTTLKGF